MNDSLLLFNDFPAAAMKGLCNDGVYEGRRESCSAGTGDAVAVSQSAICREDAAEKAERVRLGAWLHPCSTWCPLCPAEILLGLSEVRLCLASNGGCP